MNINSNFIINKAFKEPELYKEAINSIYKNNWIKAIKVELNILNSNNTWTLVLKLKLIRLIKTCWVFKIKNPNNLTLINNIIFKAQFVAKRFEQLYGFEYIKTFANIIKQISWKLLFTLIIINN